MKRILFLYLLVWYATPFYAEEKFGKYSQWKPSDTLQYNVALLEDIHRIQIRNKVNILYLQEYKPSEKIKENDYLIEAAMPSYYSKDIPVIAKEVWTKERAEEMKGKESVIFRAYLSDEGEIKELEFFLSKKTSITPQEILLFEQKLKRKKFELRTDDLKGSNYILLPFSVNFWRLADNY